MAYWLMKSEPDVYGIDDLERDRTEVWDGVRNYRARNFMRDDMAVGDLAFFYHSNAKPPGVAGIMRIHRTGVTDPTQFDPTSKYHDPKSDPDDPRWICVEVEYVETFPELVPLEALKSTPGLEDMAVVQRGQRLSVQRVTEAEWEIVLGLARG
ncbi:MAG: EVE domain-containing protein [Acidimicrobiia bacterium]